MPWERGGPRAHQPAAEHAARLSRRIHTTHHISRGVPNPFVIDEPFDVPAPDELILISSFSGGEVFRSGRTFHRGKGRIFYVSLGDQDYPVYHHPDVRRVLANGVGWPDRIADTASPLVT